MKIIIFLLLIISSGLIFCNVAYGEERIIIILPTAGNPECVDTDTCLSPSTIYIEIGDTIKLEKETTFAHSFTGGKPEGAGTLPEQGYGGPYNESGVYYFYDQVHPWIVGKIVVGITESPEQPYEESKAKSEQIKQEIQQAQEVSELAQANKYIEELKDRIQNLFDIISDLEFQI